MKKLFFFPVALLFLFAFTGCQKKSIDLDQKPQILVSIPSYETLLSTIFEDSYEVVCVVPEGFNPHYFEVKPQDMQKIQSPVYYFGVQESFEPKLIEALKTRFPKMHDYNLIDALDPDDLIQDHHCSCHHHAHLDNHIWMSPRLLIKQIAFIEKIIGNLSASQQLKAENLKQALLDLNHSMESDLKPMQGQALLVSHGSFAYFCRDFQFTQISIETEGKQPMPQDLEKIAEEVGKHRVLCVIAQIQFDQKGAKILSELLKKPFFEIDPYSKNYFEMMRYLNKSLVESAQYD